MNQFLGEPSGIKEIVSEHDELAIVLDGEPNIVLRFHRGGLVVHVNGNTTDLNWPAVDKVCKIARGCKTIYASGDVPVLRTRETETPVA